MKVEKPKKKFGANSIGVRIYSPGCSVCQYMQKNADFRRRLMASTYFTPHGHESVGDIISAFGDPFTMGTVYQHLRRHQSKDLIRSLKKFNDDGTAISQAVNSTLNIVDAPPVSTSYHQKALDEFIEEGRLKMRLGDISITATSYLQAIKIKEESEKGNKDRRLDALKTLFRGASPKKAQDLEADSVDG